MVDSSSATDPLNIGNLPDDVPREIFKRVVNQADSFAASQIRINALRNVNQKFRAVVDSEFRDETRSARFKEAMIDAGNSAGTRTANGIIIYHDVDGLATQYRIKKLAAERDINSGMDPRAAIERNDVDDPVAQNMLKEHAAERDITVGMDAGIVVKPHPLVAAWKVAARSIRGFSLAIGRRIRNLGSARREFIKLQSAMRDINADPEMVARTAIERNGVVNQVTKNMINEHAAMRDIMAGVVAGTAILRNDVLNHDTQDRLKEHAAVRDITVGMVAGTAIERNNVHDPHAQDRIKRRGAMRDITVGMIAGVAIERNGVDDQDTQDCVKWTAAVRDITVGMAAGIAIERHDVLSQDTQDHLKEHAAERDINAGVVAGIAIERHDVLNQDTQDRVKEHALRRDIDAGMSAPTAQERHKLNPCTQNSSKPYTRGLDERSRQEEGRGL
ncbi:hypothetical protein [Rhizobium laguerreae]|uniref:hypothetical protein n=1 Tax=Rhizobium laguerreae TaxID=1076926 RepID=UPI001C908137|nr:hypothetical protein [Rhizobium laguerreae]MBY3349133.1 hypothetical protein [Rhizobium laguerreae]MBY3356215.1 hypothetical protein [Rhizobium laguerreae]MBY3370244.1 hypothetical protein [Rhizobium laguerreae]MBY3377281.1 hypothetical protein [Rhizobium laguerreae]MBY3391063.1 hypothetical protein [Rhizobium laguerreae]